MGNWVVQHCFSWIQWHSHCRTSLREIANWHLRQSIKIKKLIKSHGQASAVSKAEEQRQLQYNTLCGVHHPAVMVLSFAVPAAAMGTSGKASGPKQQLPSRSPASNICILLVWQRRRQHVWCSMKC